jgi:hypothetical protein
MPQGAFYVGFWGSKCLLPHLIRQHASDLQNRPTGAAMSDYLAPPQNLWVKRARGLGLDRGSYAK